jgi:heterodisulfide reductase subunit C
MSTRTVISRATLRGEFVARVERLSGQNLRACYQCGKCSAGCPVVSRMDILPNQIVRFAQLGLEAELLASGAIWTCASCMTCNVRCPKGISIAEVIEALRQILLRGRRDHLAVGRIDDAAREELPPIALISAMRKQTS